MHVHFRWCVVFTVFTYVISEDQYLSAHCSMKNIKWKESNYENLCST